MFFFHFKVNLDKWSLCSIHGFFQVHVKANTGKWSLCSSKESQ